MTRCRRRRGRSEPRRAPPSPCARARYTAMSMRMRLEVLAILAAWVGSAALAPMAAAQDMCDPPLFVGPEEFTPASEARNVTLGAPIKVRYTAAYFRGVDPVEATALLSASEGDTGAPVSGRVDLFGEDALVLVPDVPFRPMTRYRAVAGARGGDTPRTFEFRTGSDFDRIPPTLGGIGAVSSTEVPTSCDAPDGGYRIAVSFAPATDPDGPAGDIEYLVYLTRGANVDAPRLVARARNFPTDEIVTAFVLAPDDAVEPVCISVVAVDGVGRVDSDAPASCFEPITGNYFAPICSAAAPGARTPASWLAVLALAGALALGARRRRRA